MKPLNPSCPLALALVSLAWLSACAAGDVVCGDGTIEEDGICVTSDSSKDPASCGRGTQFDPVSQTCVSDFEPVQCDPATTIEVTEDGVTTCVGVGGNADCNTPLPCPNADEGKVTVCGQLIDAGTGRRIEVDGVSTEPCDLQNPGDSGPCSVGIAFYDALGFSGDPENASPLALESLAIDECGRFQAVNIDRPPNLNMGVGLDDHPASGVDRYVLSGVAFPAGSGMTIRGVNVYAIETAANEAWTASAGNPPALEGLSFAEKGAYLAIFTRGTSRVSGVQITANGSTRPDDSFYFSDQDPFTLQTVDSDQTATGANGAGLLLNSSLGQHSGQGSEAAECQWLSTLATVIPGVIFTQERPMIDSATGEPCL